MGVLDFLAELLAAGGGGVSDLLNPAKWLTEWALGGTAGRLAAGIPVSPTLAMNLSAYFAGIRCVAEDLGKLRWEIMKKDGKKERVATEHPLYETLHNETSVELTSQQFRELVLAWALGTGSGRAEIERTQTGDVVGLWPAPPGTLVPWRDPEDWKLYYYAKPFLGFEGGLLDLDQVFDVRGISWDGVNGLSIAQLAAQDISTGLARQRFEGAIYASGAVSRLALKYPKKLDTAQLNRLRRQWSQTYGTSGGSEGMTRPVILEGGMEAQVLQINPVDLQYIENAREGVVTIARWFRLPPHKLAALDRATLNNIEHLSIEYVQDTLQAWAVRLENEARRKLLTRADRLSGYRTLIRLDDLLRGDHKTRMEGWRTQISAGMATPNEARESEGRDALSTPGADSLWMQGAMRTVESLAAAPAPAALPAGGPGPGSSPAPDDPGADDNPAPKPPPQ